MRILERRERLGKQLFDLNAGTPSASAYNPDSMTHHLEKLRTELTELRTRASAKHPDVIRVQGEIAAIEKSLAETAKDAKLDPAQSAAVLSSPEDIKHALRELDHELKNLKSEEQRLRGGRLDPAPGRTLSATCPGVPTARARLQNDQGSLFFGAPGYEDAQLAETMEQPACGADAYPAMPSRAPLRRADLSSCWVHWRSPSLWPSAA
jgi:hypothetical protein